MERHLKHTIQQHEDVLAVVCEAQEEDIDVAVKAARFAFESGPWAEMTTAERAHLIYKLADLIEEHREELAQLEALDNGKPYQVALDDDISANRRKLSILRGMGYKNYWANNSNFKRLFKLHTP